LFARDVFGSLRWGVNDADTTSAAAWLSPAEREAALAEWRELAKAEAAPTRIARDVVAWGRTHPLDPRVPRALHFAVEATRFGCQDSGTTAQSRAAYQLLHSRYPKSEWTKTTPHYY